MRRRTTQEILELQASIDRSTIRRASELSMSEKLRLGADLFDDGIRWLKQMIKAQEPDLSD
ncbi:MAG: hypothetical protein ACKO3V_01200 [Pirellula sp.]